METASYGAKGKEGKTNENKEMYLLLLNSNVTNVFATEGTLLYFMDYLKGVHIADKLIKIIITQYISNNCSTTALYSGLLQC